ncbi:MAG: hypothetical protein HYY24_02610 [Verrucomicrobia bacterium]|nr:hypothetical protein [Verrucomicrobiota bacterium]
MTDHRLIGLLSVTALLLSACFSPAVIFFSTADPAHNTTAPTGDLADSGWQYEGLWRNFLGTPIAPQYFITASHIGGAVGDQFIFRGTAYTTTAFSDDLASDLRIWRVCGSFPDFAPLYTQPNERNKPVVVFGRGTRRGAPVEVAGLLGASLKGWKWGAPDGAPRWGQNVVADVTNGDGIGPLSGNASVGELLKMTFDGAGGETEEAHLSGGDSGGGLFIKDGEVWKLAGINYAVDGPYNTASDGTGFEAVIFDEGGLYRQEAGQWVLTPDLPVPQPGAFYATRVSANLAWINGVLSAPSPADAAPVLQSAPQPTGPFTDEGTAVVDSNARIVTVARPAQTQFYRVRSCGPVKILSVRVEGGNLVLPYE